MLNQRRYPDEEQTGLDFVLIPIDGADICVQVTSPRAGQPVIWAQVQLDLSMQPGDYALTFSAGDMRLVVEVSIESDAETDLGEIHLNQSKST